MLARSIPGYISIHAPRTGSDDVLWLGGRNKGRFQSTLPARGATAIQRLKSFEPQISIHAPRTGSDILLFSSKAAFFYFNPRSPHGERLGNQRRNARMDYFNPRSPHGERQYLRHVAKSLVRISIHAPRTGSDAAALSPHCRGTRFQSTLPARGATHCPRRGGIRRGFQSTLPARGATVGKGAD